MNKKTAILSSVLVMLGIVVSIGVIASQPAASQPGTGMIKKGLNVAKKYRTEYRITPQEVIDGDLKTFEKALMDTQAGLTAKKVPQDALLNMSRNMQNAWDEMMARHAKMQGITTDAAYIQKKNQVEALLKATQDMTSKK
jgi:hypothetical protein